MRLINSQFPRIPADLGILPVLKGFRDHFGQTASQDEIHEAGTARYDAVVDFWLRVMPDQAMAEKVTTRFVRVVAAELVRKAPPENLETMAQITGMRLF